MSAIEPTVFVIDDDKAIRSAVKNLLESVGLRTEVFSSPREFLKGESKDKPGCLVLDVRLPGASGLDFQGELAKAHVEIPVIFITGHGDIPMSVQAMKAGAMDFLTKPFRDQDLLDAIQRAIGRDKARRQQQNEGVEIRNRFNSLTPREREVLFLLDHGSNAAQIADRLVISRNTARHYVQNVLMKLGAHSKLEAVAIARREGLLRSRYRAG